MKSFYKKMNSLYKDASYKRETRQNDVSKSVFFFSISVFS